MSDTDGLSLAELITYTADQIRAAASKGGKDKVMQFSGCELELSVTIKSEAGGGIKFWIVEASGKVAKEAVSKIKLNFGAIPGNPITAFQITAARDDAGPPAPKRRSRAK